jgi:hypothetical protein
MKPRLTRFTSVAALLGTISLSGLADSVLAETPSANPPTPAEYALGLLKRVADRLSAASNFTFKTTSSVEVMSPVGHMINYYSQFEIAVHRPDKLAAKKTGDGPSFDVYYDGKTFTAVDVKQGVYAQMAAPPTLDALIPAVEEKTGMHFPYSDVLVSDVYRAVTKDLTHAYWVGKTSVDGVECDHLAFAGPGIEWQLWIGPDKDPLPRRLAATHLALERQPRFLVDFTQWNLKAKVPAGRFEFKKPAGAQQIEFHPIQPAPNKP